jgi:hypothetical protein
MKIKTDFVTNSSSTSFMITMRSDIADLAKFVDKLNGHFELLCGKDVESGEMESPPTISIDNLQQTSQDVFMLEGAVPYYKGYGDLPKHIQYLLLENMNDPERLSKIGIKNLDIKIIDKNAK